MKPRYFESQAEFRAWLTKNHAKSTEMWVGFYKRAAKKPGITYKEALDEALCFGWIDAVRQGIDEQRWAIRFCPRKAKSYWSLVNIKRAKELIADGVMTPAGLAAFEQRDEKRAHKYSYERKTRELDPAYLAKVKANKKAHDFLEAQPISYRRPAIWWVMSAKKEETRERRLKSLIEYSAKGERIPPLVSPAKRRTR